MSYQRALQLIRWVISIAPSAPSLGAKLDWAYTCGFITDTQRRYCRFYGSLVASGHISF